MLLKINKFRLFRKRTRQNFGKYRKQQQNNFIIVYIVN